MRIGLLLFSLLLSLLSCLLSATWWFCFLHPTILMSLHTASTSSPLPMKKPSPGNLTLQKVESLLYQHVLLDKTSEVSYDWTCSKYDNFVDATFETGVAIYINLDRVTPRLRRYFISLLPKQSGPIESTTSMLFVDGSVMGFSRRKKTPSLKCQGDLHCTNEALRICSLCKEVRYCSSQCQQKDWDSRHYIICNGGWIKSVLPDEYNELSKTSADLQCKPIEAKKLDPDHLHTMASKFHHFQLE